MRKSLSLFNSVINFTASDSIKLLHYLLLSLNLSTKEYVTKAFICCIKYSFFMFDGTQNCIPG